VRYDLAIDLVVPLPWFVKRRAERRILNAIRELKEHAEARPGVIPPDHRVAEAFRDIVSPQRVIPESDPGE
jgi:hypothetical protein